MSFAVPLAVGRVESQRRLHVVDDILGRYRYLRYLQVGSKKEEL